MLANDYSLLRPFDLEKAKAGHPICTRDGRKARFIAHVPEADEGYRVVVFVEGEQCVSSRFESGATRRNGLAQPDLMLAPLCWVEGKPVYPGDRLYNHNLGKRIVVGFDGEHLRLTTAEGEPWGLFRPDCFTWTLPTVKREGWINIYPNGLTSGVYRSEQEANANTDATPRRLACVRIEWEESQQ